MKFINRTEELKDLDDAKKGLIVLFGRRRIGKTSLAEQWLKNKKSAYSQAIQASVGLQLEQLFLDIKPILPEGIKPKNWVEFFSTLTLVKENITLVIDEFPYLVKTSPELPSILQNWLDHKRPKNFQLLLLGSSQTMMHSLFLDSSSPLYERAVLIMHLLPMSYVHFCKALSINSLTLKSFENFSIVGGIPKYWDLILPKAEAAENARSLFFNKSSRLETEPERLLRDENISGQQAKSIFECIGRGAVRPSEIAARMELRQTSLSSPIQLLLHASLLSRDVPFPGLSKENKKSIYKISDFALRFWYQVYSPHRSRWHLYSKIKQEQLIHAHAASVLEDCFRDLYIDAHRYWEGKDIEIDSVRYDPNDLKSVIITEIKHTKLSKKKRNDEQKKLKDKFYKSKLSKKFELTSVEVFDTIDVLERLKNSN